MVLYFFSVCVIQNRILHVFDHTAEELNALMEADSQIMLWAGIGSIGSVIGMAGIPIFAYLLVHGVEHTSSLRRYALSVLVFAVISEVPYDLAMTGQLCDWSEQNSLWTVLIAAILYLLRERKGVSYGLGALVSLIYATAPLGFVPVAMCSGQRQNIKKYAFYALYPAMLVLFVCYCNKM